MRIINNRKKPTLKGIPVIVSILVLLFIMGCSKEEAYRQIKVYEIEGSAVVTREGTGEVDPYVNMMLQNKDEAATMVASYVQLQLDGDKYILMEPSTKIQLEATGDDKDSKTKINLTQGAIVNKIEKSLSEKSTYEVTTPNSTMAVRGTTFRVEVKVDEKGESYTTLAVCEGKVECRLIAPDGTVSEEPVFIEEGQQIKIRGTNDISEYVGDKENLDYEELKDKVLWFVGYVEEITEIESETEVVSETETEKETETETEIETEKEKEKEEPPVVASEKESEPESEVTAPDNGSSNSGSNSGNSGSSNSGTSTPATYTVTFKDSMGNVFATQSVTAGGTAKEPLLNPEAAGDWNFDFSSPITADTVIEWVPN